MYEPPNHKNEKQKAKNRASFPFSKCDEIAKIINVRSAKHETSKTNQIISTQ